MVDARPKIPPTRYESKVISIDDSAARHVPGYLSSLTLEDPSGTVPGWVMVFAETFVAANRAADLVKVTWRSGNAATVSERDIQNRALELIADRNGGSLLVDDPGVDAALASAKQKIERTYTTGTVMHFALEPVNALAFERDGIFEIHTGNQWQTLILPEKRLGNALGRSQDKIDPRSYLIGGGFGRLEARRRLHRHGCAGRIANTSSAGVKMVCTRPTTCASTVRDPLRRQVLRMAWAEMAAARYGDGSSSGGPGGRLR